MARNSVASALVRRFLTTAAFPPPLELFRSSLASLTICWSFLTSLDCIVPPNHPSKYRFSISNIWRFQKAPHLTSAGQE
jgi:hypothetical protein